MVKPGLCKVLAFSFPFWAILDGETPPLPLLLGGESLYRNRLFDTQLLAEVVAGNPGDALGILNLALFNHLEGFFRRF